MTKNCIIYEYTNEFKNKWKIDENAIIQSSLNDCLKRAEGLFKKKIKAFMDLAKKEKLSLKEETENYYVITTSCEFRTPKLIAAGISPFVPVNFKIWLWKKGSIVVTFDAGRKLSGVGAALLSNATTYNPAAIQHIKLGKDDFLKLKEWILSGPSFGQIRRITMYNIEVKGKKFKQILLSSNQLELSDLFNDLLNSSSVISNISFITPPSESTGRPLSCRINYWGGLTIYTSHLLDSEISELIEKLERLIIRKNSTPTLV